MAKTQTTISNTQKTGLYLMVNIGQQKHSFFDDGVVENSGIWMNCLRDELPVSRALASRGIGWAVKEGYLAREANEDQLGDEGDWLYLTAKGAKLAQSFVNETADWASIVEVAKDPTAPTAPRAPRKAKDQHDCKCGCKGQTAGLYLPGHDAKHVSQFRALILGAKSEKAAQDAWTHASEVLSSKLYGKLARQFTK